MNIGIKQVLSLVLIGLIFAPALAQDSDEPSLQDLLREGQSLLGQQEYAKAAEAYKKAVKLDDDNALAWQRLGYSLHLDGKLDEAMKAHKRAASFSDPQTKQLGLYNQACVYSLKKDSDNAFKLLNEAVAAGFRDIRQLDSDSDMDNIREDDRFEELIQLIENDGVPVKKKKKGPEIVGEWKVISGMRMGKDSADDRLPPSITFTKDKLTIPSPDGGESFVMSYKVDASKKPLAVDFKIVSGPAPDSSAFGIMKMEKGKFTLCYNAMGGDRPEKFESTDENQCHLFVMKRAAKKVSPETLAGDWNITKGTRAGEKVGAERMAGVITFDKDSITIPTGAEDFVMSYKIDDSKSPAQVDMEILSGPAPAGSPAAGIVKFDGDKLILCYDGMGGGHPEKFESTAENGYFLFELEKAID